MIKMDLKKALKRIKELEKENKDLQSKIKKQKDPWFKLEKYVSEIETDNCFGSIRIEDGKKKDEKFVKFPVPIRNCAWIFEVFDLIKDLCLDLENTYFCYPTFYKHQNTSKWLYVCVELPILPDKIKS